MTTNLDDLIGGAMFRKAAADDAQKAEQKAQHEQACATARQDLEKQLRMCLPEHIYEALHILYTNGGNGRTDAIALLNPGEPFLDNVIKITHGGFAREDASIWILRLEDTKTGSYDLLRSNGGLETFLLILGRFREGHERLREQAREKRERGQAQYQQMIETDRKQRERLERAIAVDNELAPRVEAALAVAKQTAWGWPQLGSEPYEFVCHYWTWPDGNTEYGETYHGSGYTLTAHSDNPLSPRGPLDGFLTFEEGGPYHKRRTLRLHVTDQTVITCERLVARCVADLPSDLRREVRYLIPGVEQHFEQNTGERDTEDRLQGRTIYALCDPERYNLRYDPGYELPLPWIRTAIAEDLGLDANLEQYENHPYGEFTRTVLVETADLREQHAQAIVNKDPMDDLPF